MRKKIIIGNWKMNKDPREGEDFIDSFIKEIKTLNEKVNVDFAIAPTYLGISSFKNKSFNIPLAAQNYSEYDDGSYTGEVSATMLKNSEVKYGIVGHSERRKFFKETNQTINKKIKKGIEIGLIPVFAFGESLTEYESGKTIEVITKQIKEGLEGIALTNGNMIILAYEPIWAIGTGKQATTNQAQEVCKKIREIINTLYGGKIAKEVRIQYGGSVSPETIKDLLSQPDIDGALVGGASLEPHSFIQLITSI